MKEVKINPPDDDTRREAVRLFSEGKANYSDAVRMGNFRGYGELLDALGEYGFRYPRPLPKEEIDRMAALVVHVVKNGGCLEMNYGR